MDIFRGLFSAQLWLGHLRSAAQGLLLAVPVALLFELGSWLTRRWAWRRLAPVLRGDPNREAVDLSRRRRALKDATDLLIRVIWNVAAVVVILSLWRVDPLASAVLVLVTAAVLGQVLRDWVAGYLLLYDECLYPGDLVELNDGIAGIVEEVGLRRVRLVDQKGRRCWVRTGAIELVRRAGETPPPARRADE